MTTEKQLEMVRRTHAVAVTHAREEAHKALDRVFNIYETGDDLDIIAGFEWFSARLNHRVSIRITDASA